MRHASLIVLALLSAFWSGLTAAFPSNSIPPPAHIPPWRRLTNSILGRFWFANPGHSGHDSQSDLSRTASLSRSNSWPARYGQDIVLRFNLTTADEAKAIAEASEDLYLDIWEFNENWVDIRLARELVPSLLGLLPHTLQSAHAPLMPESALAELVSRSTSAPEQPAFSPNLNDAHKDLFFSDYQPLSVIEPWMRLLASMFPSHVRLINIGLSHEGRDIRALRAGVHPNNNKQPSVPRQTIVISGGLHAREWISTSSVLYAAYSMIMSYGKTAWVTKALEDFDWVFVPTINPDGFVYSWETDRLWRKNRQPTSLRFCKGIDLDRSFGFQWDGDAYPGNPCSESYAGEEPWQATEAKQFAAWARNETENNNVELVALLDLHSYSQQVLYPYAYSCLDAPPTLENLEELALGLAKAMHGTSHGHMYKATSACEGNVYPGRARTKNGSHRMPRIEPAGGRALDWFYHELRLKYAYQIKLRDMGSYGFLLPKENIVPQGKEVVGAITYLAKYLAGEIGIDMDEGGRESLTASPQQPVSVKAEHATDYELQLDDSVLLESNSEHEEQLGLGPEDTLWDLKR